jgi:acetolactate decarboxylase
MPESGTGIMWQNMPLIALLNGYMAGNVTVKTALSHGDFGLGAFGDLDGEMVALNGKIFQIAADGKPRPREASAPLAYAQMVRFRPSAKLDLPPGTSFETISSVVNTQMPVGNSTYAVRIVGSFPMLRARAPRKQLVPYPVFCEATKTQVTFSLDEREGTMAGFIGPPYIGAMDSAGYHLHFLAKDEKSGGHVLSFQTNHATIELERIDRMIVDTPHDAKFDRTPMVSIATCP